jgi:DNA-binding transcriptional ArsR family regulator
MARPFITATDQADVFRAVAHRWRRVLLERLMEQPSNVGDLHRNLPITMATLSSHLRILRDAGLVKAERHGHSLVYHPQLRRLDAIRRWLALSEKAAKQK